LLGLKLGSLLSFLGYFLSFFYSTASFCEISISFSAKIKDQAKSFLFEVVYLINKFRVLIEDFIDFLSKLGDLSFIIVEVTDVGLVLFCSLSSLKFRMPELLLKLTVLLHFLVYLFSEITHKDDNVIRQLSKIASL